MPTMSLIGVGTPRQTGERGKNKGYKERFMAQAYCVKCRTKREIKDPEAVTMKNGKAAVSGLCPVCGTKIFRIGKIG